MNESDPRGLPEQSKDRPARPAGCASVSVGVLAAATLEDACRSHTASPDEERLGLYVSSVEELARDLGSELAALSGKVADGERAAVFAALASAALRAADLATLAACAVPELPPESPARLRAAAAARLAAAATRAVALERRALGAPDEHEARDLQGTEWRAGLAVRQVEEMEETPESE